MNMSLCMLLCFWQRKSRGAAEFTWSVFNFQKDQDVRVKLGYEVTHQNKLGNEVFDKVYSPPWVKHKYAYSWFTFLDQFIGSFQLAVSSVLHSGFFSILKSQFLLCFHLLVFTLCFLNVVGSLCSLSHAFFFFPFNLLFQVPYLQIRENNWTFNADVSGRWNVRYDLWGTELHLFVWRWEMYLQNTCYFVFCWTANKQGQIID